MNVADYTYLLNHPETINERRTEELDKIVAEFPYFQSARALRLKGLYNADSFRYNYALKVAAAYTADRSVLFDFITSDSFSSVEKALYDKKRDELHAITVSGGEHVTETAEPGNLSANLDSEFIPEAELAQGHLPPEPETAQHDPATQSILDSIKEAEQYARGLSVADAEEVKTEPQAIADEVPEQTAGNLELGRPLEFSRSEKHSFQEWLQLSQIKPILRGDAEPKAPEAGTKGDDSETDSERQKKNELIDRFIETNPKIPPVKPEGKSTPFIFEPSQADNSYLMTETLARVYLEQKKFEKAIQAYEILILKYPEKSSFFADRILDIRILQQNNKL